MSTAWKQRLDAGGVLLLDGGTGSELRRRGYALDAGAWSALAPLTHYDLLCAIHADYIAAGADVITTSTFAASRFVLDGAGHGADFAAVTGRALSAARDARDHAGRDVAIAGSVSCLPPRFDPNAYPDARTESEAYRELAETLADGGADLIALEMLEDVEHAARACDAARATGLPVWLGVSCRARADGTLAAFDFPDMDLGHVLEALLPFAPAAVNVMHTPPSSVAPALRAARARFAGTLGAYPEIESERPEVTPHELAALAGGWIAEGARIVGGCCGATPAHIRALRAAIDALAHAHAKPATGSAS